VSIIPARPALDVDDLHVTFRVPGGDVRALRGASLAVAPGEILGLVGESGSGKSVLGLTALGLLPHSSRADVTGTVRLDGEDMVTASEEQRRARRGAYITAVFQDPMGSLKPVHAGRGAGRRGARRERARADPRAARPDRDPRAPCQGPLLPRMNSPAGCASG